MRTIAVVNQKGGCGKTITSINLSAFLALAGRRVLLVDIDPQGHSTLGLSPAGVPATRTMYDVFLGETGRSQVTLADIIRSVDLNFDLAPADIRLSAIPESLAGVAGRENILSRVLADLEQHYDYIIIDCPPTVGLLTFNALKASTEALVPMEPSFFSLHGIGKLFETFQVLERETGHRISARVLVTQYSGRTSFVRDVVSEVHRHLAGEHYATVIRHSVKLAEAASHGLPVTRYATQSVGYQDYQALAKEVLQEETAATARETAGLAAAPTLTRDGVLFSIEAPDAAHVQIAGDFNDWTPEGTDMEAVGGVWRKTLKLPPGRYRYRYVIDGRWQSDPLNETAEPSPFGGHDSLIVLEEPQTPEWLVPQGKDNGSA